MVAAEAAGVPHGDSAVIVTRIVDGPPGRVFDAWLDPALLRAFMCPGEIERADVTIEARAGGTFRIDMHERSGRTFAHSGSYLEIRRPDFLKFTWISDATNNLPSVVTVDLKAQGRDTLLTLTHERLPMAQAERHELGWTSILDKLDTALLARGR